MPVSGPPALRDKGSYFSCSGQQLNMLSPVILGTPSDNLATLHSASALDQSPIRVREDTKTVISYSRLTALRRATIHIAPISITLYVLSLSFRSTYLESLKNNPDANTILNALQFVAKLHEVLICASISSIVLWQIQHGLLNSSGVPLGLLTSAFRLSDALYIFSKEFRGGASARRRANESRYVYLATTITISIILSLIAGPATAISILPKLDRWAIPLIRLPEWQAYLGQGLQELMQDPSTNLLRTECFTVAEDDCPGGGLTQIWQSIDQFKVPINITMPIIKTQLTRYLACSPTKGTYTGLTPDSESRFSYVASTLPHHIASTLAGLWETTLLWQYRWGSPQINTTALPDNGQMIKTSLMDSAGTPHLFKPFVHVQCAIHRANDTPPGLELPHSMESLPPLDQYAGQPWIVPQSMIPTISGGDWISINFTWATDVMIGNASTPLSSAPSVRGIIFAVPNVQSEASYTSSAWIPCTVDARWVPTEMWLLPTSDPIVHETYPDPIELLDRIADFQNLQVIHLDLEWVATLNAPTPAISSSDPNPSYLIDMAVWCNENWDSELAACITWNLAATFADGIARAYMRVPQIFWQGSDIGERKYDPLEALSLTHENEISYQDLQNSSRFTAYNVQVSEFGYGYNMSGITIRIAAAILLLHVLVAVIHVSIVLRDGRTSFSWSTMTEMIVLAMNSMPTERLRNTCAGVWELGTWKEIVKVRERKAEHLELVFDGGLDDDEEIGDLPRPNRRYGAFPDLKED
jgi:hypothetical protein